MDNTNKHLLDTTPYKVGDVVKVDWSEELFTIERFDIDIVGHDKFLMFVEEGGFIRPSDVIEIVI